MKFRTLNFFILILFPTFSSFVYAQKIPFGFFRRPAVSATSCPTGYILVPRNSQYSNINFCVGKYEASQSGSAGVSVAGATPWVGVTRAQAVAACEANGAGYHLITDYQWQTIARNIDAQTGNWSSGKINRGHSDNSPANVLASSTSDTNPCSGTGQTCSDTVWNEQRRTHILSTGSVIWDFAGNADEYIADDNLQTASSGGSWPATTTASQIYIDLYGPVTPVPGGDYANNFGYWYWNASSSTNAIARGGWYGFNFSGSTVTGISGIYAVDALSAKTATPAYRGFRCTYSPP